jgi:hypothetical protein
LRVTAGVARTPTPSVKVASEGKTRARDPSRIRRVAAGSKISLFLMSTGA